MLVYKANKTMQDFNRVSAIMMEHEKSWDCSWDVYENDLKRRFRSATTETWIAIKDGKAVGFIMAAEVTGVNHEAIVLCSNVIKGAGFKECMRMLASSVLKWCELIKANRVMWFATTGADKWIDVLAPCATDKFPASGINMKTIMSWEKSNV